MRHETPLPPRCSICGHADSEAYVDKLVRYRVCNACGHRAQISDYPPAPGTRRAERKGRGTF